MKLTEEQLKKAVVVGENGGSVTLFLLKALPNASDADIDREMDRVFDSMEYPE